MILYLIGIDYRSTPLSLRESAYKIRNEIINFWQGPENERIALFTCNRVELYGVSEDIFQASRDINLFRKAFPSIFEGSYVKQGTVEVIEHMLRLACGLESQASGEEEILGQLSSWIRQNPFPWILKKLWSEVLTRAQEIRIKSGLKGLNSNLATIIFKDLKRQKEIVVIGTGKIAQVFAENRPEGISLSFAARKRHKRAKELARQAGGRAVLLDDLPDVLLSTDAVISATSSPHYVLKKEHFLDSLQKRSRPLYIYDLAVPRDIEPEVGDIRGIFLRNLDDLNSIFEQHRKALDSYIKKAGLLILHHSFALPREIDLRRKLYAYSS